MALLLLGCERQTEKSVQVESLFLENGKHVKVEKTNKETTSTGIITKHDYGTTHSFNYKIYLEDEELEWQGTESQEPKSIVFCKEDIYLRGIEKNRKRLQVIDSTTNDNDTIRTSYYKM